MNRLMVKSLSLEGLHDRMPWQRPIVAKPGIPGVVATSVFAKPAYAKHLRSTN